MAENVTLNSVTSFQNDSSAVATVNNNMNTITTAFVDVLSRSGTSPNQMASALDMNGNQIINLPAPSTQNSPARLIDVVSNPTIVIPATGTSGHVVPFLDGVNTWTGTQNFSGATVVLPTLLQGLTWGRNAKSGGYTVLNTDKGSNLSFTGPSFYTITFGPVSTYDTNFSVIITNDDSVRAKTISIPGYSNFLLWPLQSIIVFSNGAASGGGWKILGQSRFLTVPTNATLHVDNVAGSDTNDGLARGSGGAVQTLARAVAITQQYFDPQGSLQPIEIAQTAANYTEILVIAGGLCGTFLYEIFGQAGQNPVWTGAISVKDMAACSVSNMTFTPTQGTQSLNSDQCGIMDIDTNVTFGPAPNLGHITASNGGSVNIDFPYTIAGGGGHIGNHWIAQTAGRINVNVNSITISSGFTLDTSFAFASSCGVITCGSGIITFGGAGAGSVTGQTYQTFSAGGINSGGSVFPGTVAGVANTPGWKI